MKLQRRRFENGQPTFLIITNSYRALTLNKIPSTMSLENKEYDLLAVSKCIEGGLGHYTMILNINYEFLK